MIANGSDFESGRPRVVLSAPRRAAGLAAMLLTWSAVAAPDPAAPPPQDRAQLERRLEEARSRLDDAARDVAELTGKLYGRADDDGDDIRLRHASDRPRGAMLGINIGGEQNRTEGVEVMGVSPSGPAESAGLRKGDLITSVDGKPLRKDGERGPGRQLVEHLRGVEPGQVVRLDYLRAGKKLAATVTTVPAEPPVMRMVREHLPMLEGMEIPRELEDLGMGPHGRGFRSLELVSITPKLGQYFGADKGLLVVRAPAGSDWKLEEGDVILTIGGRTPESPRHAFRILGSYQPTEQVRIEVLRQRKRLAFDLRVPAGGGMAPFTRPLPAPRPAAPPPPPTPPAAPTTTSARATATTFRG